MKQPQKIVHQIVKVPDYKPFLIVCAAGLVVVSIALIIASLHRATELPHKVILRSIMVEIDGTNYFCFPDSTATTR